MTRLAVGALALALVLAACGGGPKADPTPTKSASPTASATPSATSPALPEEAQADTKAGAIAFVRYFIRAFDDAQATGSTTTLADLVDGECVECAAILDGLHGIYAAGGAITGGALETKAATAEHNSVQNVWLVLVRVESGPQSVVTAVGATPSHHPGGARTMKFTIRRTGTSWKVLKWAGA